MVSKKISRKKKIICPAIFILSGPAGAGKTTLLNRLFRRKLIKENFLKATSFTTRKKRRREKETKDYCFVAKKEFLNLKRKGFFLETQRVVEDYYGTPKHFWKTATKNKKSLILCIDVKGGMYLKKKFKLDRIITIFITVGKEELRRRLEKRIEGQSVIKKRMQLAKKELRFSKDYDYLIINRDLKTTLGTLETIFLMESFRRDYGR